MASGLQGYFLASYVADQSSCIILLFSFDNPNVVEDVELFCVVGDFTGEANKLGEASAVLSDGTIEGLTGVRLPLLLWDVAFLKSKCSVSCSH